MKKNGKNIAFAAAIAAGIGYVAGILTAPKSGKETREDIKTSAGEATVKIEKALKKLHEEATELLAKNRKKLEALAGKAKEELQALITKAEVARQKAREVLSALHEGEADDKDLEKAVKQLKEAVDNLKKYAQKPVEKA